MLVLSRKLGEKIRIGENITVTIVDIDRGKIRLGINVDRQREPTPKEKLEGLEGSEPCRCFVGRDPEHWWCTMPGGTLFKTRKRDRAQAEKWLRGILGMKRDDPFPPGTKWEQASWPHCPHAGKEESLNELLAKAQRHYPDKTPIEIWSHVCLCTMGEEYADRPLAPATRSTLPGTPAKINLMQQRVNKDKCRPTNYGDLQLEEVSEKIQFHPINSEGERAPERNGRVPNRVIGFAGANREDEGVILWTCKLPSGRIIEGIRAHSKSEARAVAKQALDFNKKESLPKGTILERSDRVTPELLIPKKSIPKKLRDKAYRIAMRCAEIGFLPPHWVQAVLAT